jgi:hypothetical protein
MQAWTYQCPYCYEDFKTIETSDDVDFTCDNGHSFTLGEARRGRPDPANQDEVAALKERVDQLEKQVAVLIVSVESLKRRTVSRGVA